jgi:HEAT repeat protein
MPALAPLAAALRSPDPVLAADAARLLGETANPAAIPSLLQYARKSRHHHKAAAIHALAKLAPNAPQNLQDKTRQALRQLHANPNTHDDWYWTGHRGLKASIALALLHLDDDSLAPYLHALADKNDDVFFAWLAPAILQLPASRAAAQLQKRITPEAIINPPPSSTRRSEPGLLVMKAQTLALLPAKESTNALIDLTKFHSRYVRGQAAISLLKLAPTQTGTIEKLHKKDPTDFVKIQSARALKLPAPITKLAQSTPDPLDRAIALEALAALNSRTAFATIQKQLTHPHFYV